MTTGLAIELGGIAVGVIEQHGGGSRFVPDPVWAAMPAGRRPVLGQRFEERPWTEVRSGQGLPDWFEHMLPEAGGPLRRAVARSLDVREASSFAIAELVGEDLPGAVVFRPLSGSGGRVAAGRRVVREDTGSEAAFGRLRFSLAGVQLKFSARATERGLVIGYGGDQIVKLADQRYDAVPTNEHAVMTWARSTGLDVPGTRLVPAHELVELPGGLELRDPTAFVIERYDRGPDGARIHQEDMAQVLGLSPREGKRDKYEGTNLDSIVRVLTTIAPDDTDELVRRIVFMILSANNDMHAKNWSVIYPDGVRPRLAPAYDQLCTDLYMGDRRMAFKLGGAAKLDAVSPSTLEALAKRTGLDVDRTLQVARATIQAALEAWPDARGLAPAAVADYLDGWLDHCPLVRHLK